ncbi:MAG: crossover junction endodeoxyribonuclease RuvC [Bdellovibrionaceae bacterium]|nr:crossover junction endodeoxyribonuclease RuvC [Pseudobdellovibrionaceae bacterium]
MKVILGIDPGSHHTGYGLLEADGDRIRHLAHGVLSAPASLGFHDRLHRIANELNTVFLTYRPQITVVERIFLGRNADSAFKLGHVRGVCLFAATQANTTIVEYAARSVKKGITGSGAASKEQVQFVLFNSLGIRIPAQADASDALALAYFHARNLDVEARFARQFPSGAP